MENIDPMTLKHLEFIQNIVSRMSQSSFMVKGWSMALAVALLGVSTKTSEVLSIFSFLPIIVFWGSISRTTL